MFNYFQDKEEFRIIKPIFCASSGFVSGTCEIPAHVKIDYVKIYIKNCSEKKCQCNCVLDRRKAVLVQTNE